MTGWNPTCVCGPWWPPSYPPHYWPPPAMYFAGGAAIVGGMIGFGVGLPHNNAAGGGRGYGVGFANRISWALRA